MISNEIFAQNLSGCRLLHRQGHSGGRLGFPRKYLLDHLTTLIIPPPIFGSAFDDLTLFVSKYERCYDSVAMEKTYIVTLTPGEDGYIVAECPTLPGCVSQGKTREEALKSIREAIQGIIELRRAQNLPIPCPDIVEISVAA
jgi:predicted RNase H-like HicB family nuclease